MSLSAEKNISLWTKEGKTQNSENFNMTAKLTNTVNSIGFGAFNHRKIISRKDILSSYSKKILEESWLQFSNFIKKNYEAGKGTNIKGFGTFTFTNPEYNLEGTTNQYNRDLKLRRPVFIVSNEFLDFLKPGIFTNRGGLIYYTQKLNNNVSIVKFNYTELAYSLNISKEECQHIIMNIIKEMGEMIINKTFKSRDLPGLGIIVIRGNILGVKFYDNFNLQVYKQTEKLNFTKRNLELYMDLHKTDQASADILNAEKAVKELVPKDSVITHLVDGADTWMQNNLDLKPEEYDDDKKTNEQFNKIENYDTQQKWNGNKFFTALSHNKLYKSPKGLLIKANQLGRSSSVININQKKASLKNLGLNKDILESLVANKGQIIKEMKIYDRRNNGLISRFEVARAFQKSNIHPSLTMNNINEIILIYARDLDYVDYYKLITSMIKEIKQILKGSSFCKFENDNLASTFNSKFLRGRINIDRKENRILGSKGLSSSMGNILKNEYSTNINEFDSENYSSLQVKIIEVEKEITSIKLIFDEVMNHKQTHFRTADLEKFIDDNNEINYIDFIQLLRVFNITYPTDKVLKILKFIKIENPLKMTLNILNNKLNKCKVSSSEMSHYEIEEALKNLLNDPKLNIEKNLFKSSPTEEISLRQFLILTHNKTIYSDNILTELFHKMSNKKDTLTFNEFISFYNNPLYSDKSNNILTERFFEISCERILNHAKSLGKNINEYFNKLLSYNYLRKSNVMYKQDFVLAMLQESYEPPFKEKELEYIFEKMDTNHNNLLERSEFKYAVSKEYSALYKMHDIIKRLRLTNEDLSYRLDIKPDPNKKLNFYQFKAKLKKMDCYYTNEFIEGLYTELVGSTDNYINCKYLLDSLNVYQKGIFTKTNNETFKKNFINNIQNIVDYHTLKAAFEKEDKNFSGKISKNTFCKIISGFTKEFKDEDLMKFVRVAGITDRITYEVKYDKFINMIYFDEKLDNFLFCVSEIKKIFDKEGGDINKVISILNGNDETKYVTTDKLLTFFKNNIKEDKLGIDDHINITKTIICKFDLDGDGKISFEDLRGILQRYANTDFFKYENSEKGQYVNLFSSDTVTNEQFKAIVRKIKETMKKKNITEVGLFKKLDEDNDGFINNYEFNKNIKDIMDLNPAIKDKFFNYLDCYHNGMVDLETFLLRFKEFRSSEAIIENNNNIENVILNKFSEFINKNDNKLNDTEIFSLIDKDSDGLVSLEDFKHFVIDSLGVSKMEFNDFKLERVMQSISLSKNKNIGLSDIREFMNKSLSRNINSYYVDLKETYKEINNQNLFRGKKNKEWITQAIERLGMFITEKFDGAEKFFELYADKTSNKFKLENFIKFHESNFECFYGFNLTRDELLSIFTSLDSQKKNYLTLEDFKNKLELFDFYRKMHLDIKNFLHNNFPSQIDSFKYFLPSNNDNYSDSFNGFHSCYQSPQRTFSKGFNRPFDSSGIINPKASGLLLKKYYDNKNKTNGRYGFNEGNKIFMNINGNNRFYITKKEFFDGINNVFPKKYPTDTILNYMKKYFNININDKSSENLQENIITFSQFTFVYYGKIVNDSDFSSGNSSNESSTLGATRSSSYFIKRPTKMSTTRSNITAKCLRDFDVLNRKNAQGRKPYNHNLYRNEEEIIGPHSLSHIDHPFELLAHEKLITPFDNEPLEKIRRIITSSPNANYMEKIIKFIDEHKGINGICNEFEFKSLIKSLSLGITNIEIDDIIRKCGKTYDGKLNINDFYKYITSTDKNIIKASNNLMQTLSEIKQLLYKYYSNPKLAFTFNDSQQSNTMDFDKYKNIISELYKREDRPIPNFALIKNSYDYIDLRKDGLIDMVEWSNAFGNMNGKLDLLKPRIENQKNQLKNLRRWEMSNNVIDIYKNIFRNRRAIAQKVKEISFGLESEIIQENNLIQILKDIFPFYRLTNTQWKMIVELGEKNDQGFINFDTFLKLVENCSKRDEMPRFK